MSLPAVSQAPSKEDDDESLESAATMHRKLTERRRPVEYLTICTAVSWILGRQNVASSSAAKAATGGSSLLSVQQIDPEAQERHSKKKEEMMAINIRRATIREFFNDLHEQPQLLFLQEVDFFLLLLYHL
uniref:Uncharacterized protein n=1 Tax=Plectus sambesii TaxID=2011161 RepID=A0A914XDD3_9BILA